MIFQPFLTNENNFRDFLFASLPIGGGAGDTKKKGT